MRFRESVVRRRAKSQQAIELEDARETEGGVTTVPFLWNHRLLLPEVIADVRRLERMNPLLTHTPVSASMVVYDFIPLLHPEVCESSDGFLALFDFAADRRSHLMHQSGCRTGRGRDILPLIDRDRPPPLVETHYLGGDFDSCGGNARRSRGRTADGAGRRFHQVRRIKFCAAGDGRRPESRLSLSRRLCRQPQ